MNVLCHGIPFCCDYTPLRLYQGVHDIRTLGIHPASQYQYDPCETATQVVNRIGADWRPDLILCWMPEIHPPPQEIESCPIPTAALVSDWHLYYSILRRNLARFDVVLADMRGAEVLANPWVSPDYLMPLYSQLTDIHRPYGLPKDIDLIYLGSLHHPTHPDRAKFLQRLAMLGNRYRIVFGCGIQAEAYGRLLSRARLVMNYALRGELNLRVFEAFACGAALLLEESNLEAGQWLEDGRDVILYNHQNFEAQIDRYLDEKDACQAIAANGLRRAIEFAGENRFDALIHGIIDRIGHGRRFVDLPESEKQYETAIFYGGSRWPEYDAIEQRLVTQYAMQHPNDPRGWTLLGRHLLHSGADEAERKLGEDRVLKTLLQAHRLDPASAPYAINVATMHRSRSEETQQVEYLQRVLAAQSIDGADLVLGNVFNAFFLRWHRLVAEGRATLEVMQAEARIRLATILARIGHAHLAENYLLEAILIDPANAGGTRLLAEIQWATDRREEAVRTLLDNIEAFPLDLAYRKRLAAMLRELGDSPAANALELEIALIESVHLLPPDLSRERTP